MYTPEFNPGYEVSTPDGRTYRVIESLNDYAVRVWDYQNNCETVLEKREFAIY
mgnify:CR=1 FL=1